MSGSRITGWGTALPGRIVTNAELAASLGIDTEWIWTRTGIRERRIAGKEETTTSLAATATRAACARAGLTPRDLDTVIVATITPDRRIPGAGPMLAAEIGAIQAWAYDLNAGCSGFLVALAQATALVRSGSAERVAVCGADLLSRITDWTDPQSCILFGDGAGAVVVEVSERDALGPFVLGSDGSHPEMLWTRSSDGLIEMQGREVYKRAVSEMASSVSAAAAAAGAALDDIDLVVAHQANARILAAVADRLGLPAERFATNIATVGNTSAASIPLALDSALSEDRIADDAGVMLTAFGAGFTWGAGLVRWQPSPTAQEIQEKVTVDA